jgi:hypothetical protein
MLVMAAEYSVTGYKVEHWVSILGGGGTFPLAATSRQPLELEKLRTHFTGVFPSKIKQSEYEGPPGPEIKKKYCSLSHTSSRTNV